MTLAQTAAYLWNRALGRTADKVPAGEADYMSREVIQAAREANSRPEVEAVVAKIYYRRAGFVGDSPQDFQKLPQSPSGEEYGDIVLTYGGLEEIEALAVAKGVILNRRGEDGLRPTDRLFSAVKSGRFARGLELGDAPWTDAVGKVSAALHAGVAVDQEAVGHLRLGCDDGVCSKNPRVEQEFQAARQELKQDLVRLGHSSAELNF